MREQFAETFYACGKKDARLAIVVADISPAGSIARFREEFPERFINTGVAEQIMIGMAAGMALRGMRPFAYTIATFALYRPFEFVRNDIAYQGLPVTVVGVGGGVVYSTLGGTHHAMEDVAIAASIPGMQVLAPCDPDEARQITEWCATMNQKPTYLRLGKTGEKNLTEHAVDPLIIGKIRYLRKGTTICLLSYGPSMMKMALELADRFTSERGESVSVVSCHTLKPLDTEGIALLLKQHRSVVVLEEHVVHGGLGSQVKAIAWDTQAGCRLAHYALRDQFIHVYGAHDQLLKAHGLTIDGVYRDLTVV
ncbi:MAG: transketolase [Coxiella sp. RIFCSPHIGHO2_12_FULL_44_14]|nr:MAG: transketolase [Coxiella sp. RIFCSPHIGHO2_12_FULL_44_14]